MNHNKLRAILLVATFLVSPALLNSLFATSEDGVSPRVAELHRRAIVVDTHIDTPMRLLDEGFDMAHRDALGHIDIPRMREGGLDAAFFSIWVDPRKYKDDGAVERALQLIATVYEQVERHPNDLLLARTAGDIRRAHREGKVALLMGLEGGHPIEDNLRILRTYAELGVRYMTLSHSINNHWADSSTDEPVHNGLTDFGKQVVRELNRLGIIVDISHVSDKTFYDALEVTQAPVIASHSSCRALVGIPRNMSDDLLRALAKNGGVVQVAFGSWFIDYAYTETSEDPAVKEWQSARRKQIDEQCGDDAKCRSLEGLKMNIEYQKKIARGTMQDIANHIEHVIQVAGIDHVGYGSDFDGVGSLPTGMDDVTFLPALTQELADRGYSDEDIFKILGGNTLRVMEAVERVAARAQGR
jgi:membrane dipeptidase